MFFRNLILSCLVFITININAQVNTYDQLPVNLKNGLVAYYPFNNSVNDIGINGYNGTIQGGSVPFVADRFGNSAAAAQLGGGYITASNSVFNYQRTDQFTISIWFTKDNNNPSGRLLSTECPEGNFRMGAGYNGEYAVQFGDYINDTVPIGTWTHLVYTYDNRNEKVYINGMLKYTNYDLVTEGLNYCALFTIGAKASSAFDRWVGKVDDLAVYNRALNNSEVNQLFTVKSSSEFDTAFDCSTVLFNPLQDTISVCSDSILLNVDHSNSSVLWSTGEITSQIIARYSGIYAVSITDTNGCRLYDTTFLSLVKAEINVSDTIINLGDSIILSSNITADNGGQESLTSSITSGLLAFYPFNSNAKDESGNHLDGIVNNVTLTKDRFGRSNSAYSFNGLNSFIETGLSHLSDTAYTISCWFKSNVLQSDEIGLVLSRGGYNDATGLVFIGDSYLGSVISYCDNTSNYGYTTGPIIDNRWHNFTTTYDRGVVKLYYDGNLVFSGGVSQTICVNRNFIIGNDNIVPNRFFEGDMDDVAFWGRTLNDSEVKELFYSNPSLIKKSIWSTGDTTSSITVSPKSNTTYTLTVTDGITSCSDQIIVNVRGTRYGVNTISIKPSEFPYQWNNQTITTPGRYRFNTVADNGSDSVSFLNINLLPEISYPQPSLFQINSPITPLIPIQTGSIVQGKYGRVTTYAGTGSIGSTNGVSDSSEFNFPTDVEVDANGNVFVTDKNNHKIRKITPNGIVSTLAGSPANGNGFADGIGDNAVFSLPTGITIDSLGNLFVADRSSNRIRKITPEGVVSTIAGEGNFGTDDGYNTSAKFTYPYDITLDPLGNIWVTDEFNHLIRKIDTSGYVSTVAGTGVGGSQDGIGQNASVSWPEGIILANDGKLLFTDFGNNKIRSITQSAEVGTFAGNGNAGIDNTHKISSSFNYPGDLVQDGSGNIFVADKGNHVVRKISSTGIVTTFAGTGVAGNVDGNLDTARFYNPTGVALDSVGSIYVADQWNHKIRKIERGFKVTPSLPEGLYIDSIGRILGMPIVASPETIYTVIAENNYGSDTATFSLSVLDCDIPDFNPFSDTTSLCGTSIELNAGNSYSNYLWNNSATTNSITALSSGWYSVIVTNENGCRGIDSTYLSLVNADILQTDTTICFGTDKILSLNNFPDYFGFYSDKSTHDATFDGSFYTENFNLYAGELNAGNNGPSPLVPLDFPDQNLYSFSALANPGGLFVFNRSSLALPNDQHSVQLSTITQLDDLIISFNGAPVHIFSGYFSITDVDRSPMFLGKIIEFNPGQLTPTTTNDATIIITLSNGSVYNYKANASGEFVGFTSSIPIESIIVRSAVFINGIQNVGYATLDDLKFGTTASSTIGNINQLIPGSSILWSTSDTTSSIIVSPQVTTQYKVTVTDNITTCSDSITITVPVIDNSLISLDTTAICAGSSARLQAGVASSYVWLKNGVVINGASSRIYTATSAGNYRVVVTNATGCSDTSAVVTITERPLPESGSISGGGVSVCSGTNSTGLSLSGAVGTIRWQSSLDSLVFTDIANETGNGHTATNLSATTYYRVITTNSCGNDTSAIVKITVNPTPVARFSVDNASQQLRANLFVFTNISTPATGVSYYWDFDNGFFSNLKNPSYGYRTAGTYQVKLKVTTDAGCVDSTSLSVEVREAPIALNDQFSTAHATLLSGNVASNDTPSPDGGNVWSLVGANGGSLGGTASMTSAGILTYTPRLGYAGTDTLTYQVCDSNGDCVQAKVSILVAAAPPTPPPSPAAGNLYVAGTTCAQFNGRTASALTRLCYTVRTTPATRRNPAVTSVSAVTPTSFMYYVRVTAPSTSFTVNIGQVVDRAGFRLFTVNTGGSVASGDNCVRVASVTTPSTGQARVSISRATTGRTYIIGVRYDTSPLVGYVTNGTLTANYTFSAKIGTQTLSNSTSSVTLYPNNCASAPASIISSRMPNSKEIDNNSNSTNTSTKALSITNLSLKVYPNPTSHYFIVVVEGGAPQTEGVLRVMNMVGQLIEEKKQVKPGQLIQLGHQYINGMYLIEYIQGTDRVTLKVNKQ